MVHVTEQHRALYQERHNWARQHEEDVAGVKDILERAAAGVTVALAIPEDARLMLVLREAEKMAEANDKHDWAAAIALLHKHSRGRVRRFNVREGIARRRVLVMAILRKNASWRKLLDDSVIWALRSAVWARDLSIGQP
ncbi:hypothetical protein PRZ48_005218 [Zasmidium cellare]|uniref:Uncharacterized protein n=1 Tax=Zasmidium cellare TaxID=395010 RepID=A0ABR0ERT8_ZASCE|nr:hypothetical protein PRZ48_005218 [Zasmidium cellare]